MGFKILKNGLEWLGEARGSEWIFKKNNACVGVGQSDLKWLRVAQSRPEQKMVMPKFHLKEMHDSYHNYQPLLSKVARLSLYYILYIISAYVF